MLAHATLGRLDKAFDSDQTWQLMPVKEIHSFGARRSQMEIDYYTNLCKTQTTLHAQSINNFETYVIVRIFCLFSNGNIAPKNNLPKELSYYYY